ncbi:ABC transporter substrate-binding protein [Bradyrhizobium sp. PMVTL-01]|uniref:ABC transporter substrate-binding protein n=1 Tax=unclassified Bradyrhizobium TaxID=2631580 RepID=UPI003F6F93E8
MKRREAIVVLASMLTAGTAFGQKATSKRVIGVLMGATNDAEAAARGSIFEDALRRLGWRSGENVTIEYRFAAGDPKLVRSHAMELVGMKPDVILGDGTSATAGLREATGTIPIIFVQVTDPVGTGLVASLAEPGGNVTGFSNYEFSMGGKWLDIIRQINPGVKRVGVLYNPQVGPFGKLYVQAINEAGMAANVRIEAAQATDTNGMEAFVDSLSPEYEALIVLPDIFTVTHQKAIITKVAQRRLLTMYPFPYFVNAGGLVAYGVDQRDLFRRSASYVDRVLRGESPSALPVQRPVTFRLAVNRTAASAQGISLPATLLAVADDIVE